MQETINRRTYKLGAHSAAHMVPQFLRKPTAKETIRAVCNAVETANLPFNYEQCVGLAAYVWYTRSNHRKCDHAPRYEGIVFDPAIGYTKGYTDFLQGQADYHRMYGVYPVCPVALTKVKHDTIAKYAALVFNVRYTLPQA